MKDSLRKSNNCLLIPCFNEVRTIRKVVTQAAGFDADIIVIDDGSTDGSVEQILDCPDVILLQHPANTGKGSALNTGFAYAAAMGYTACVTLDADLQHPPGQIPDFFKKLDRSDIVLGVRKRIGSAMPIQRMVSNFLTTLLLQLKTGVNFKDSQCGYRGYRLMALEGILPDMSGFMAETEVLINAARKKCSIDFVSIPVIYGDTDSKMKPVESIIAFLRLLLFK